MCVRRTVRRTVPTTQRSRRYTLKLKQDFECVAADAFPAPGDIDRIQSILADMNKTAGDLEAIVGRLVEQASNVLQPRIR